MTVVSNDPAWFPFISAASLIDYSVVVSSAVVVYDWALTFGQEVELVWMRRWSFMNVLYICVRYIGILYSVIIILWNLPVSMTDVLLYYVEHNDCNSCLIVHFISTWTPVVVNAMLGVIMMFRIRAMYRGSKKILIFLVLVLLASTIASGVLKVMSNIGVSVEEFIIYGYHTCLSETDTDQLDLVYESLISTAIWEILAFVLAVWIVIKHFRELRQCPTGSTIGDCFMVLTQSHAFYFVAFAVVACFSLGSLSTYVRYSSAVGSVLYSAILQIAQVLQMFVLGPRLILSVREYNAKLVARSDEGTGMTALYFHAGGDALTSGDV
ncbi:hypothetical protein EV702DRAFT_1203046 [Suillus placidus]|uniref:DUF6533 domain-containing protein n=1 Tax=Suillus placidus TaxID=48579 RepID=A0A9P7CXV5_9AGAM|nr:hypothetical protein EV702DRAFT_1203046 [Suillus placidus]